MAKKKETPTLQKEIAGLLKERKFVLHCVNITSSTAFFNKVNEELLDHFTRQAKAVAKSEKECNDFIAVMHEHFDEIRQLRLLYDNLKQD